MRGLYLVSSSLFAHAEKMALCSLLKTSIVAEMMFGAIERKGVTKWQLIHTQIQAKIHTHFYTHTDSSHQCCVR